MTTQTIEENETAVINYNPGLPIPGFTLPEDATPEQRMEVACLLSQFLGESISLEEFYGHIITIIGVLQHPVELTNKFTGEIGSFLRTAFLLEDETVASSVSAQTDKFVKNVLLPCFGKHGEPGLLLLPVQVQINKIKTPKGSTYSFKVVKSTPTK